MGREHIQIEAQDRNHWLSIDTTLTSIFLSGESTSQGVKKEEKRAERKYI